MKAAHDMLANLEAQVAIYRRLLNLTQAQVAALRERDVKTVHAVLQEIELAMLDRGKIELQREQLLNVLAKELGVPVGEITVTLLQGIVDEPIAEVLGRCSNELKHLIGDLDLVIARSRGLLEQELQLIDTMVLGVTRKADALTYGRTGNHGDVDRLKILDAQV
jgi:hypothetical protein